MPDDLPLPRRAAAGRGARCRPVRAASRLVCRGQAQRAERRERDDAGHRQRRGAASGAHRAAKGPRPRPHVLHQPAEPQGRRTRPRPPGGDAVPLENAAAAGADRRSVVPTSAEEADAYYATRGRHVPPRRWASDQSRPLPSRACWSVGWPSSTRAIRATPFRGRRTGRATACCPIPWSSGRTCRTACTTARCSPAPPAAAGQAASCIPDARPLMFGVDDPDRLAGCAPT